MLLDVFMLLNHIDNRDSEGLFEGWIVCLSPMDSCEIDKVCIPVL
jgi:hypothetical protein